MSSKASENRPSASAVSARRATIASGKYRPFARLGTGGMADVFLAVAQGAMNVNRLVVIKRLRDEQAGDEQAREMFLNEARLAARLSHQNVIQITEAGSEAGSYFLVMEYVDGQPLSRVLGKLKKEGKTLEPRLAARIWADALAGLHYAHELKDFDGTPLELVHRDVSPQNVMITYEGVVKLVDFGIAKAVGTSQTAHGVFKGKVAFMAPEQVLGEQVDRRADVFAAGIVLWECLTGKALLAEESPAKTLYNLMNKPIPLASSVAPSVPAELDAIVARALERDLAKRWQSAKEMRDALERFLLGSNACSGEAVGSVVAEMFGDVRERVQGQIREQLSELALQKQNDAFDTAHELSHTQIRPTQPMLIDLADIASVGTDSSVSSGALYRVVTSGGTTHLAPEPPSKTKRAALAIWIGVTVLALAASVVALLRSTPGPAPAPVAPERTLATTPQAAAGETPATATTPPGATVAPSAEATATAAQATSTGAARPVYRPVAAPRATPHPAAPTAEPKPAPAASAPATTPKPQETSQGRTFRRDL